MFKSALIYQFTEGHQAPSQEQLEVALAEHVCAPMMSQDVIRSGFTHVHAERFTFGISDLTLFAFISKEKQLPASVIASACAKEYRKFADRNGRPASRKEKQEIKDDVVQSLLPHAFVLEKVTRCYVDNESGMIVINTGSGSRAEEILSLLRKAFGSLHVRPWFPDCDPRYVMTSWLREQSLPEGFGQNFAVTLDDRGKSEAIFKNIPLGSTEVQAALSAGHMVSKIALTFEHVEFTLTDWLQVGAITPSDTYKAELDGEDESDRLASELFLFAQWIRNLMTAVDAAMAGTDV